MLSGTDWIFWGVASFLWVLWCIPQTPYILGIECKHQTDHLAQRQMYCWHWEPYLIDRDPTWGRQLLARVRKLEKFLWWESHLAWLYVPCIQSIVYLMIQSASGKKITHLLTLLKTIGRGACWCELCQVFPQLSFHSCYLSLGRMCPSRVWMDIVSLFHELSFWQALGIRWAWRSRGLVSEELQRSV